MLHGKPGDGIFLVRNYVCSPESFSYSGIMSQKLGCLYSGLMLVILDSDRTWDYVNMEWQLVILDYDPSPGFHSYYGILGTQNGGFNTLSPLHFIILDHPSMGHLGLYVGPVKVLVQYLI